MVLCVYRSPVPRDLFVSMCCVLTVAFCPLCIFCQRVLRVDGVTYFCQGAVCLPWPCYLFFRRVLCLYRTSPVPRDLFVSGLCVFHVPCDLFVSGCCVFTVAQFPVTSFFVRG